MFSLALLHPRQFVEIGDLAGDLYRNLAGIEVRNPAYPEVPATAAALKASRPTPFD